MPAGSSVEAGGAFVKISADNNPLTKGLNAAAAHLKKFGDSVSAIGKQFSIMGAAITAPLLAAAKLSASAGAAIYDMSRRTGIGTEALQGFAYAAEQTGTDLGAFEVAIKRMQKTISGVKDEFEGTTGSLSEFGITAEQIKGLSPDKQFELIASKIAEIEDPTQRAAAAMRVFGKSGTTVIPMIERLSELQGRAKSLGLIKPDAEIRAEKQLEDTYKDLKMISESVGASIAKAIAPAIREAATLFLRGSIYVRKFINEHPQLIANALKAGTAITIAGTALYGFGKAVSFAAFAMKLVSVTAFADIALVGVAAVGATAGILYFSGNGGRALKYLADSFNFMRDEAKAAFKGISDALAAGDIVLGAQILWTALKIGWLDFKMFFNNLIRATAEFFLETWYRAISGLKVAFEELKSYAFSIKVTLMTGDEFKKELAKLHAKSVAANNKLQAENDPKKQERIYKDELLPALNEERRLINAHNMSTGDFVSEESKRANEAAQEELAKKIAELKSQKEGAGDAAEREKLEGEKKGLEKQLDDLRKKAEEERGKAPNLPDLLPPPNSAGAYDPSLATRSSAPSAGTFNPNAIFGISGGGGPAEQTAKNTETLVRTVAQLNRAVFSALNGGDGVGAIWQ